MFPRKILFDYSREIVGSFLAYVFLIYFIVYFVPISVYLNIELSSVLKTEFFPKSPKWAMLAAGVIIFGGIAYKGISGVARFFEIIVPIFVITSIGVHLIMLSQGDATNIMPLFRSSEAPRYLLPSRMPLCRIWVWKCLLLYLSLKKMERKRSAPHSLYCCLSVCITCLSWKLSP